MGVSPLQVVFLADTELLLPGASGSESVLDDLRESSQELLESALEELDPQAIAVFAAPKSRFGRPLPGRLVASSLLKYAGYTGQILGKSGDPELQREREDPAPLWLVMGTGGAAYGDRAPLVADERALTVDVELAHLLRTATWPTSTESIDFETAEQVGATMVPSLAMANTAKDGNEPFTCADYFQTQEFGVTYFAVRWIQSDGKFR